jgi:phosphoglycerate dehydrogenase-like enzyme
MKVAILDDYQDVALKMADWSAVAAKTDITVFNDHIVDTEVLVERLAPFDVICVMRERTPISRETIERLPRLKMIASTGPVNASIDATAAQERGIHVSATGYWSAPAIELTWALILAAARRIIDESNSVRNGGWQTSIGLQLNGKTLGVMGLGRIGGQVARVGIAFGMKVIAWSENLTVEAAEAVGVARVPKEQLLRQADFLTIHLVLSRRTRGVVGATELALMNHTAWLINTSRGPVVDEAALISALQDHMIAGAGLDVFNNEPLPESHPFRTLRNVIATPHIGYVADDLYRTFYTEAAANIASWLETYLIEGRTDG